MSNQLHPIHDGVIVLVGVKASNLSQEIRDHPQVVMWESQNEHWLNKDLPTNTRAVFFTRWIGHNAFSNIVKQARKRQITIFNPEGTGMITRQVKELLGMGGYPIPQAEPIVDVSPITVAKPIVTEMDVTKKDEETMTPVKRGGFQPKLNELLQYVDLNKGNLDNAKVMMEQAKRMGIQTTLGSLSQKVSVMRRKAGKGLRPTMTRSTTRMPKGQSMKRAISEDVGLDSLEKIIMELKEVRNYLAETVAENVKLRARLDKFKKFFED